MPMVAPLVDMITKWHHDVKMTSQPLTVVPPSAALMHAVRAGFVAQGTSFSKWCTDNEISRTWAIAALTGKRAGPAAQQLRHRIVREATRVAA